ncbi:hypothetical protein ACWCP5_13915, partial [Streptomyces sp. NPDC002159]
LGHDLAADIMGSVGFGELAFWLATQRRPSSDPFGWGTALVVAGARHDTPRRVVLVISLSIRPLSAAY